jgi:hypothetical protein
MSPIIDLEQYSLNICRLRALHNRTDKSEFRTLVHTAGTTA